MDEGCGRQAGAHLSGGFQPAECVRNRLLEFAQRLQYTLPRQGLSFAEAYLEGRLWLALQYAPAQPEIYKSGAGVLAMVNSKSDSFYSAASVVAGCVNEVEPVNVEIGGGGQENLVFVGDVEAVKLVKPKLPAFIGLKLIQDNIKDVGGGRWSLLFQSLDGTLKRFPRIAEWEGSPAIGDVAVDFGNDTVSVIEGGPEVVERIAQDRGRVFWEVGAKDVPPLFQRAVLALGAQSLFVLRDVPPEKGFKLVDVMFGPFYL